MSSNNSTESQPFDYQGYLLFNGLYTTEFIRDTLGSKAKASAQFSDKLPEYDPNDPSKDDGYEQIRLDYAISDSEVVDDRLKEISDSLITYRYRYEDRTEEKAYVNGKLDLVEVPNVHDADIIWAYPDYIFIRGAQGDVSEAREKTFRTLVDDVHSDPVSFGGDFLLWLYYKHFEGDTIPGAIQVDELTDGEITGDRDAFGETNSVDDSTNLRQCVPIIVGILKDKSLSELEGYFTLFDDYKIKSAISQEDGGGRVHVKASEGAISVSSDATRRMALSVNFVRELVELRSRWEDLPPTEKYPPRSFFANLYQTARDQDIDIERISRNVLRNYATKRNEDPDDW